MAQQQNLFLCQVMAQVPGEFDAIEFDAFRFGRRVRILCVGFAGAALIPLNDREVFSYTAYVLRRKTAHRPGPPCTTSSTALSTLAPRMVIHWSLPPSLTKRASWIDGAIEFGNPESAAVTTNRQP